MLSTVTAAGKRSRCKLTGPENPEESGGAQDGDEPAAALGVGFAERARPEEFDQQLDQAVQSQVVSLY